MSQVCFHVKFGVGKEVEVAYVMEEAFSMGDEEAGADWGPRSPVILLSKAIEFKAKTTLNSRAFWIFFFWFRL